MPNALPYNQALPTVLTAVTAPTFEVRINQIVRLFLQISGTPFANSAAMKLKATWDGLIAASDATKIIYTPLMSGTKITPSKALESGSDSNTTYRGLPEYYGEGVAKITGTFRGKDSASMNSIVNSGASTLSLMNSAGLSTLVAYGLNNDGHFICNSDFSGIRFYNFTLRSRGTEGLNSNDIIEWSADLEPNWDSLLIPVVPSFDPRNYI